MSKMDCVGSISCRIAGSKGTYIFNLGRNLLPSCYVHMAWKFKISPEMDENVTSSYLCQSQYGY